MIKDKTSLLTIIITTFVTVFSTQILFFVFALSGYIERIDRHEADIEKTRTEIRAIDSKYDVALGEMIRKIHSVEINQAVVNEQYTNITNTLRRMERNIKELNN